MSERDLRNANIGILAGVLIVVVGAAVFRNSGEAALQLVGLISFVGALAVYMILDELSERRGKRPHQ